MTQQDRIFDKPHSVSDFKFGEKVVSVFDDMVVRSVPFYLEIQRMITEMAYDFAPADTIVYDLGCSTGTTLSNLDRALDPSVKFVGVDDSQEMLNKCEENLKKTGISRSYQLVCTDLNQGLLLDNASVVIMCLTLQFVRPLFREKLVKSIYDQLNDNGCLILVEKVLGEQSLLNRLFIKYYYDYKKRNNYNEIEIAQKREALENVLIPYKLEENKKLLEECGFKHIEVFFKWYNFSGLIGVK